MDTETAGNLAWDQPPATPIVTPPLTATRSRETTVRPLRKILHLINGEHYSGAERVQDLLAARLPESGYEVGFVCVKPGRFAECRRATQAALFDFPMRSRFDFRVVGQVAERAAADGYELLHAHTPRTVMIGRLVASRLGLPLVYHVHSPTARDSNRPWANRINSLTERFSISGVSRLIAVSDSLAEHMRQQGVASELISVVPNGVPTVAERPERTAPTTSWTLGTVALFRARKGTEVLLHALARLRAQGLPLRLRAVGGFETPEYERHLRQLTGELRLTDHVDWVGFQRDVNAQLAEIDLFVLPSLYGEGLPNAVLEAMAAGVPVIATDVPGCRDLIRDNETGWLVRPGDPADISRAITAALADKSERLRLGGAGQAWVESNLSIHHWISRWRELYRRLLDAPFG